MASSPPWPISTISEVELYYFLLEFVGVKDTDLTALVLEGTPTRPSTLNIQDIRERFIQALGMPEPRIEFAKAKGFSYQKVTNWVIRTDLLRAIPFSISDVKRQEVAEKMAARGIEGVHHLATNFAKSGSICDSMSDNEVKEIEAQAKQLAQSTPQIVTASQAILVVKGAGTQQQDETLDSFLKGFWPAVVQQFPTATLTENPSFTSKTSTGQPEKPKSVSRIAEIRVGENRLWVKESFWEPGLLPPGSLSALLLEWRMATYVLGRVFWGLVSSPIQAKRREAMDEGDLGRYWFAFLIAHFLVFLPVAVVFWHIPVAWLPIQGGNDIRFAFITTSLIVMLMSISPAVDTDLIWKASEGGKKLEPLPGVSGWLLVVLIVTFLIHPARYLAFLAIFVGLQILLIILRIGFWEYRAHPESDTNLNEWDVDRREKDEGQVVSRFKGNGLERFVTSPWLYRYIVVIALPIIALLLLLAGILKAIAITRDIGTMIENLANALLSGRLGDVVIYANEPGVATWVRGVIVADIQSFHERTDVDTIHIFSHSQGTPITFETLFYHLPKALRRKIKTYITFGSVLNYLHHANWVFDLFYIKRFPRHPYPRPKDDFHEDFQWVNFWNHNDPIPEFAPLDAYGDYAPDAKQPRALSQRDPFTRSIEEPELNPSSPINIRTRGHWNPLTSHSEYWSNMREIYEPFVKRIFDTYKYKRLTQHDWQPKVRWLGLSYAHWLFAVWVPFVLIGVIGGVILVFAVPPEWVLFGYTTAGSSIDAWIRQNIPILDWLVLQRINASDSKMAQTGFEGSVPLVDWLSLFIFIFAFVNWVYQMLSSFVRSRTVR